MQLFFSCLFTFCIFAVNIICLDADPDEVVFIQNATTGIDSVIRSLMKEFQPGDSILMLDIAYGSIISHVRVYSSSLIYINPTGTVRFVIEDATKDTGVTVTEAVVPLPVKSPQQVCYEGTLILILMFFLVRLSSL